MQDHSRYSEHTSRLPIVLVAGVSALVVALGGGTAAFLSRQALMPQPTQTSQGPSDQALDPASESTARVYWLQDTGTSLELAPRPVQVAANASPSVALERAFTTLLTAQPTGEQASTIPAGTQLRSLSVKEDGVHVDLSENFTQGGGSASMTGRVAQVLYTATSLDPDAPVWISVEGKPLEVLGGEGIAVAQPLTREAFQQDFRL